MTLQEAKALAREVTAVNQATTDQAEALAEFVLALAPALEALVDAAARHADNVGVIHDAIRMAQHAKNATRIREMIALLETADDEVMAAAMKLADALTGVTEPTGAIAGG